jgi:hypothetical protein
LFANSLMAIVGDVFGPAVAALTLGLFARKQLARRMGRNSASTMPAMSALLWWLPRSASLPDDIHDTSADDDDGSFQANRRHNVNDPHKTGYRNGSECQRWQAVI